MNKKKAGKDTFSLKLKQKKKLAHEMKTNGEDKKKFNATLSPKIKFKLLHLN